MSVVDRLLSLAERRERAEFRAVVARLAGDSPNIDAVVAVLADVQREVGRRWAADEWSVADEHLVTGMVELAVADVAVADVAVADPPDRAPEGEPTGDVVSTCVEGEWHVLPARMLSEQLRARGWRVTFLGASLPGAHLRRFAVRAEPLAVALSCSVPVFLPGAWRCVQLAHAADVPVLVGGAAFGGDERRAFAIGADGWAADAGGADRVLREWARERPRLSDVVVDGRAALALGAARVDVVAAAAERLTSVLGDDACPESPPSTWAEQLLTWIVEVVEASLVTRDDAVVEKAVPWLTAVLTARRYPDSSVGAALDALVGALPPTHGAAHRLLATARGMADGRGS